MTATVKEPLTPDAICVVRQDMPEDRSTVVLQIILDVFNAHDSELGCAQAIKEALDDQLGPRWHCVVGRHFASHVAYEAQSYLYVKIGREVCLVFRSSATTPPDPKL